MRNVMPMRVAKIGYMVISGLFCLAGLFMIIRQELSALWMGSLLGVALMIFGVIKLVGYFSKDLFRLAFQHDLALGVLLLVLGAMIVLHPDNTMSFSCTLLGVSVLAESLLRLQGALDAKLFGIPEWRLLLALSVLSGLAGVLMVFHPWESAQALTALLGCGLFLCGLLNLIMAICTVKIVPHQKPDVWEK